MIAVVATVLGLAALAGAQPRCADAEVDTTSAQSALEEKRFNDAERLLERLQRDFPDCAGVIVTAGRLELAKHRYDQADRLSERALAVSPGYASALAFRGQMLAMQGREPEGRELLERAVRAAPNDAEACFQLGVLYDRAKQNERAVSMFEKVVALRPQDPRGYDYLGLNLEPLGKVDSAQDAFKKGLAVNSGPRFDYFLDYNYGRLLLKLNRLAESKIHLDKAVELAPQMRATHYDHAKLNVRLENFAAARNDAERALSIPDRGGLILDLQVYSLLAIIYTRLGEGELARKYTELSERTRVPLRAGERK